jgi:hypothetical protein
MPLPNEINPQNAFERMFGDIGSAEERAARFKSKASILDSVISAASRLNSQLAPQDRSTVEEYLTNVREVESRIQASGQRADAAGETPDAPAGIPGSYDEHVRVMYDLIALAWRADITRVTTFMNGVEASSIGYPQIGVPGRTTSSRTTVVSPRHRQVREDQRTIFRCSATSSEAAYDSGRRRLLARPFARHVRSSGMEPAATSTIRTWSPSCSRGVAVA